MNFIGNLIWFVFGGLVNFISWMVVGLLWCITVVGIPVGLQCFKIASLSLWPMGREVVSTGGGGSLLLNLLWLIFGGIEIAAVMAMSGLFLCITIVGIPFGLQQFKLARLALMPFGAQVV